MAYPNGPITKSSLGVTSDTTMIVPAGYAIISMIFENNTANSITGGVRVGTSNAATDVAVAIAVGANAILGIPDATILKTYFSPTVDQTLFFQAVVAWNSANINIRLVLARVI